MFTNNFIVPRRSLIKGGVAAAALASLTRQANASNVPFTTFAFDATNGTSPRTQPDRDADFKNVLDFGADPTGTTDSWQAIQNCVNWTSGANRGTIFFPAGSYQVSQPVTFNYNGALSIRFLGVGATSSFIQQYSGAGGFTGDFLFDRHNVNGGSPLYQQGSIVFDSLSMTNTPGTGNTGGCVRVGSTIGACFRDCTFSGITCVTGEDSPGNCSQNILFDNCRFNASGGGTGTGTYGGNGPTNCVIFGNGASLFACDFVAADVGIRAYGSGFSVNGCRLETLNTAIMLGVDSGNNPQTTSGFSIIATEYEACYAMVDFLAPCSAFYISGGGVGHPTAGYPQTNPSVYGMRIRAGNASSGVIEDFGVGENFSQYGIFIGNASSRANLLFNAASGAQAGSSGQGWSMPTNAYTAWFTNSNNPVAIWTFSQLPSGGNVVEGDEYNISDSSTATWGATVSGGGSNHALVRYNGTNWTVVGV